MPNRRLSTLRKNSPLQALFWSACLLILRKNGDEDRKFLKNTDDRIEMDIRYMRPAQSTSCTRNPANKRRITDFCVIHNASWAKAEKDIRVSSQSPH